MNQILGDGAVVNIAAGAFRTADVVGPIGAAGINCTVGQYSRGPFGGLISICRRSGGNA